MFMDIREAVSDLGDGHALWKPEYAREICEAIGVKYDKKLEHKTYSNRNKVGFKGIQMNDGQEGATAVDGGSLASYVAYQLGVGNKAQAKIGRGSQAAEYARVVAEKLIADGKMKPYSEGVKNG